MKIRLGPHPRYTHFSPTGDDGCVVSDLDRFFFHLGVSVSEKEMCSTPCEIDFNPDDGINVFGVRVSVPAALLPEEEWRFWLDSRPEGYKVFGINDHWLGASFLSEMDPDILDTLTRAVPCLHLQGYPSPVWLERILRMEHLQALGLEDDPNEYDERPEDLSALAGLKELTSLAVMRLDSRIDVDDLAGLTNLTSLDLSCCFWLTDVSGLADLTKLTHLSLYGCMDLADVEPLKGLTKLRQLNLEGCQSLKQI